MVNLGRRRPRGEIYHSVGLPNMVNGQPIVRATATVIHWEDLGVKPEAIAINAARKIPRYQPSFAQHGNDPVAIVAYGQSLNKTWELVRNFKTIFTCSGAHRYLIDRGIIPTFHVDCDPRIHKIDILGKPHPEVTYLICSCCNPAYFDMLEKNDANVKLWHLFFAEPEIHALVPSGEQILTGAGSVGGRAMTIAVLEGYTNLHFFGFDACEGHADFHPNRPTNFYPYKFEGKMYATTDNWIAHAEQLLDDLDGLPQVKSTFHGSGLLQDMAASWVHVPRKPLPLGIMKP
jgi:hypothetical protein